MKLSRRLAIAGDVRIGALACSPAARAESKDERIVLGFSQIGAESEWRTANTESIKSAAITSNIDLRFADAQQKQENQIKALRTLHRAEGRRDRVLAGGRDRLGHGAQEAQGGRHSR